MRIIVFCLFSLGFSAQARISWVRENHTLTLKDGTELHVFLKKPRTNSSHSLPAILLFGGFQTGAAAIDLVEPGEPVMLVTFEYPLRLPKKFSVFKNLDVIPKAKKAMHQTNEGINELVKWVGNQESVDPEKIILVGASFGAPFVSIAAGRNSQVKGLILVHGFADVPATAAFLLEKKWKRPLGYFSAFTARSVARFAWWYTGMPSPLESLAELKSHQHVLLFTANNDDFLPQTAKESLRQVLKKSKAQWSERVLNTVHIQSNSTNLIRDIVNDSMKWQSTL